MKNKLEKQLRSFIDFDYSKRTIDRFHRWMISSDSAEEKDRYACECRSADFLDFPWKTAEDGAYGIG